MKQYIFFNINLYFNTILNSILNHLINSALFYYKYILIIKEKFENKN